MDRPHIEILLEGVASWNQWRSENHTIVPNLSGEDLSERDLSNVDLSEADLSNADLFGCNLSSANLKMANLTGADFSDATMRKAELYKASARDTSFVKVDLTEADLGSADFSDADLRGSDLSRANLEGAQLGDADLRQADLTGANLSLAHMVGTKLQFANLAHVNAIGLNYLPYNRMRGCYHGVRGLDSLFGNAIFVRDAQDQDYLDTLEISIDQTESNWLKKLKRTGFKAWEWIDFGRSLLRPTIFGTVIALGFGIVFLLDMQLQWGLIDFSGSPSSWLTPFYFSVVTFTTLGYGDVLPIHWVGESLVIIEVVLGYSTLGLLLSILANKVARRS